MSEEKIKNKRVLVTGGAGFIGSNLCEALLKQGNEVICLDNFLTGKKENIKPLLKNKKFHFIEGDIRNQKDCKKAVDGVQIILHQAALGSVPRSVHDPITTNNVNIDGFLNMLFAAKEAKVKRFVYASSSSVYGDEKNLPKVENKIGNPLSPYAITKYTNELYAINFSSLYGIETIGLRYFNVFGKQQDPEGMYAAAIPKFIKAFVSGNSPVIYGDGTQSRDFTYIENVIQANNLAATTSGKKSLNTIYNVAYGESTTLNELIILLQELLGKFDPSIKKIKIVYGKEREGEIKYSLASINKAKKLLGYSPKFNFKTGLRQAIQWYWENMK